MKQKARVQNICTLVGLSNNPMLSFQPLMDKIGMAIKHLFAGVQQIHRTAKRSLLRKRYSCLRKNHVSSRRLALPESMPSSCQMVFTLIATWFNDSFHKLGCVTANYISTHSGHDLITPEELSFRRISKEKRREILSMLRMGVPRKRIMANCNVSLIGRVEREHASNVPNFLNAISPPEYTHLCLRAFQISG